MAKANRNVIKNANENWKGHLAKWVTVRGQPGADWMWAAMTTNYSSYRWGAIQYEKLWGFENHAIWGQQPAFTYWRHANGYNAVTVGTSRDRCRRRAANLRNTQRITHCCAHSVKAVDAARCVRAGKNQFGVKGIWAVRQGNWIAHKWDGKLAHAGVFPVVQRKVWYYKPVGWWRSVRTFRMVTEKRVNAIWWTC